MYDDLCGAKEISIYKDKAIVTLYGRKQHIR